MFHKNSKLILLVLLMAAFAGSSNTLAGDIEYEKKIGDDYVVHFSAVLTDTLAPDTARVYNIQRSGNRAMVSVSVLKINTMKNNQPIAADIKIDARNFTGQNRNIKLNKIVDSGSIYYIGTFPITNREKINFDLTIQPKDSKQSYNVQFKREFYVN